MRLRRCFAVVLESREQRSLDLESLWAGAAAWSLQPQWLALAAHRDDPVALSAAAVAVLGALSPSAWTQRDALVREHGDAAIAELLAAGLLVAEDDAADAGVRDGHWHPLAAIAHRHLRWRGVDAVAAKRDAVEAEPEASLLARLGPPPPVASGIGHAGATTPLPEPPSRAIDALCDARVTGRNFDPGRALPLADLSAVLARSHRARARSDVGGVEVLKKTVPSAGGLHPVEARLLVQRVDGLSPGLYRYDPLRHALACTRGLAAEATAGLALRLVAGQAWFADAPVLLVLVARFARNFWKYRQHAKAWRAVLLDAGHLSQQQYLAATDLGLAAFITAAVNEGEIEDAFGLDPMAEGVVAVTGFGHRAASPRWLEFDPLARAWPQPLPPPGEPVV